jgi:signal peptidase I
MLWIIFSFALFGFAGPPVSAFSVPSNSMAETLVVGDVIMVAMDAYANRDPQRGDVVVFYVHEHDSTVYIKRVIGLPGDRVQMIKGVLYINGDAVPRVRDGDYATKDAFGAQTKAARYRETLSNGVSYETLDFEENGPLDNTKEFQVPLGNYFVMGDNRDNSGDSRIKQIGFIPRSRFIGRALEVLSSHDRETGEVHHNRFSQPIR